MSTIKNGQIWLYRHFNDDATDFEICGCHKNTKI